MAQVKTKRNHITISKPFTKIVVEFFFAIYYDRNITVTFRCNFDHRYLIYIFSKTCQEHCDRLISHCQESETGLVSLSPKTWRNSMPRQNHSVLVLMLILDIVFSTWWGSLAEDWDLFSTQRSWVLVSLSRSPPWYTRSSPCGSRQRPYWPPICCVIRTTTLAIINDHHHQCP